MDVLGEQQEGLKDVCDSGLAKRNDLLSFNKKFAMLMFLLYDSMTLSMCLVLRPKIYDKYAMWTFYVYCDF